MTLPEKHRSGTPAGGQSQLKNQETQTATLIDWQELQRFLQAIGRNAGPLVLTLFPPDPSKPCIHFSCDAEAMPWQEIEATQRRKPELALGLVMNHALQRPADWGSKPEHLNRSGKPKAWGASDSHISQAIGIWGECDGGLSIQEQQALPGAAGLPEPTLTVRTGGKSLHLYWLLEPSELLEPGQFRELQQRLAEALANASPAAGADRSIHNPARLMRVPGGIHPATGNRCSIHGGSGQRFTVAELLAMLPEPEPAPCPPPGLQQQARLQEAYRLHELLPKELERLALEGADKGGEKGRNNGRNSNAFKLAAAAYAIAPAAAAAGLRVDGSPESLVLDFAARCRPPLEEREAMACIASAQSRNPKPDAGWPERLRFHLNRAHQRPKPTMPMNGEAFIPADGPSNGAAPWGQGDTAAEQPAARQRPQKPEPPSFDERWELLELHAAELACTTWPVMKTIASLSCKASELEIPRLGQRQLEQLLEQAQRRIRDKSEPVLGGQTFTIKPTHWAVEGIFRHGLNLLTGQSGAGKSRLAAACMAAWLRGDPSWLQRPLQGGDPRHRYALIVGTDQTLEDWHLTLGPVGLTTKISDTEVQVHERLTLYSLETGIQLDADGLNTIRRWVDAHPGGMVLVDSLAQCLPAGVDEDKSSAAGPVHKLQEVLGDAWAILTHHTRKGAGKEGNLGVGAGRGSGAIDAAVSRVVGLGLIYRMENGVMLPQESDPRRELLSTKRGGKTEHIIISSDASGFWDVHGSAEALKARERQERVMANLTEAQSSVLSAFDTADGWLSTRGIAEAMGDVYEATGSKAAGLRKVLKRLVVLGVLDQRKVGNENSYRASLNHLNQREVELKGSVGSVVAAQGISLAQPLAQSGSDRPTEPPEPPEPLPEPPATAEPLPEPLPEPPRPTAPQGLSHLNHQSSQSVRSGGSGPSSAVLGLVDLLAIPTAPIGSGADVLDSDGDDPAWGERPEAA